MGYKSGNSDIPEQFIDNLGIMAPDMLKEISVKKIAIIGVGGIGGHLANNLARMGVVKMKLIDFDQYSLKNLNRQLFSNTENIGRYKAEVVRDNIVKISPKCHVEVCIRHIQDIDFNEFEDIDYLLDAVDNPKTKIYIANLGKKLKIPVLHGACAGWYFQVGWLLPDSDLIEELYEDNEMGLEKDLANPAFTPAATAAIMTAEFVKFLTQPKKATVNKLLLVDLLNCSVIKTDEYLRK